MQTSVLSNREPCVVNKKMVQKERGARRHSPICNKIEVFSGRTSHPSTYFLTGRQADLGAKRLRHRPTACLWLQPSSHWRRTGPAINHNHRQRPLGSHQPSSLPNLQQSSQEDYCDCATDSVSAGVCLEKRARGHIFVKQKPLHKF